jgi:hypothetical protein
MARRACWYQDLHLQASARWLVRLAGASGWRAAGWCAGVCQPTARTAETDPTLPALPALPVLPTPAARPLAGLPNAHSPRIRATARRPRARYGAKGQPEIDCTKVDSTMKVEEYDEETQGAIRKIMVRPSPVRSQGAPNRRRHRRRRRFPSPRNCVCGVCVRAVRSEAEAIGSTDQR